MFNLIAFFIIVVGGINWFCIGVFQFDIIAGIFGSQAHFISRFLYTIVGLASIYLLIALPIKKWKVYEAKDNSNNKTQDYNVIFKTNTKTTQSAIIKQSRKLKPAKI